MNSDKENTNLNTNANTDKIPLLVICGPTASGKTRLSVDLALEYGGEIVSADSMQVYRELSVITARVTEEEARGVPHHLAGFLPLGQSFSTADWCALAREIIADIYARGRLPIVCGGTGLYISSLIDNVVFDDPGADMRLREELEKYAEQNGRHALWERLRAADPEAAAAIHENNLIRVVRALEVCMTTGGRFSEQKLANKRGGAPYNVCLLRLDFEDRAKLYERINLRVDEMLRNGMVEEARRVRQIGTATARQAIGYKELLPYLDGTAELDECIERIKQGTRRYAKRQLTWFRRMDSAQTIYVPESGEYEIFYENVKNTIAKSGIL